MHTICGKGIITKTLGKMKKPFELVQSCNSGGKSLNIAQSIVIYEYCNYTEDMPGGKGVNYSKYEI